MAKLAHDRTQKKLLQIGSRERDCKFLGKIIPLREVFFPTEGQTANPRKTIEDKRNDTIKPLTFPRTSRRTAS
jgi:hypothetical protein